MGGTAWVLKGAGHAYCNCDYGCPCQFMGRPSSSDGSCRAAQFIQIDEGQYGSTDLNGLRFGWLVSWPGAVHEGNGVMQLFIDESASEEQREAIRRIAYNEDTDELLTSFSIYHAMCTTAHDPIFAAIDLEFDAEARTAHSEVPGIVVADAFDRTDFSLDFGRQYFGDRAHRCGQRHDDRNLEIVIDLDFVD